MAGKITCQAMAGVNWNTPSEPLSLELNQVHVWRVNHSIGNDLLSSYQSILDAEELQKAKRFFKIEDRCRYIITRATLRIILSKYLKISAADIAFESGENKKPQLRGAGQSLCFNVSHSGSYSLIGISRSNLGIDIELFNNQFNYSDIVKNYFNQNEIDFIASSTEPAQSFFTCWTRKEAILKAISTGLNGKLQDTPCLDGEHMIDPLITDKNWIVNTFNVDELHIGSLAVEEGFKMITWFNWDHFI